MTLTWYVPMMHYTEEGTGRNPGGRNDYPANNRPQLCRTDQVLSLARPPCVAKYDAERKDRQRTIRYNSGQWRLSNIATHL